MENQNFNQESQSEIQKNRHSLFQKNYILVVLTVTILFIGMGFVFAFKQYSSEQIKSEKVAGQVLYEGWRTYVNEEFGFEISYPEDEFVLDEINNQQTESETREIGRLEMREGNWSEYRDVIKLSNPNISWIVNKKTNSINDECRTYSEEFEFGEEEILGQIFTVREVVASDDVGEGGLYYKEYSLNMADRCFLIRSSVGLQDYKANSNNVDLRIKKVMAALEDVIGTFEITGPKVVIPSDWQTYIDERFKFSFRYPSDWRMFNDFESVSTTRIVLTGEDGTVRVTMVIPPKHIEPNTKNNIVFYNYAGQQSDLYWPPVASEGTGIKHQDVWVRINKPNTLPAGLRISYSNGKVEKEDFYKFYDEIVYKILSSVNVDDYDWYSTWDWSSGEGIIISRDRHITLDDLPNVELEKGVVVDPALHRTELGSSNLESRISNVKFSRDQEKVAFITSHNGWSILWVYDYPKEAFSTLLLEKDRYIQEIDWNSKDMITLQYGSGTVENLDISRSPEYPRAVR